MQKFKKLLAIFFAVVLAVTFMPNIPQGTVKAAEAGENTSYDKAISVSTGEKVSFTSNKSGDNYPSYYYTFTPEESGTYLVELTKNQDDNNSLSLSLYSNSEYYYYSLNANGKKTVQLTKGTTYGLTISSYSGASEKPGSLSGSFRISKSDIQFTQQMDGEDFNEGSGTVDAYYNSTKKLSVQVEGTDTYSYQWKTSMSDKVLSEESSYEYTVLDNGIITCTITNSSGESVTAEYDFNCKEIKVNSVTVNGKTKTKKYECSYSFFDVDPSSLTITVDAVNLVNPNEALNYSWKGTNYSGPISTSENIDSQTNSINGEQCYSSYSCHITGANGIYEDVDISVVYKETITTSLTYYVNDKKIDDDEDVSPTINDKVKIVIDAKSTISDNLTYQWYQDNKKIENATSETFTPDTSHGGVQYCGCLVSDGKSVPEYVNAIFNVSSIKNISSSIEVNGKQVDANDEDDPIVVDTNDKAILKASAESSTGEVSYAWYGNGDEDSKLGEGESLTLTNAMSGYEYITCVVSDKTIDETLYYNIQYKSTISGDQQIFINDKEIIEQSFNGEYYDVLASDKVELKVNVNSTNGNNNLKYEWKLDDNKQKETGDTFTVPKEELLKNIESSMDVTCKVTDGISSKYYKYTLTVDLVRAEQQVIVNGGIIYPKDGSWSIPSSGKSSLKIKFDSSNSKTYHYQWRKRQGDGESKWIIIKDATGDTSSEIEYELTDLEDDDYSYICTVSDEDGNEEDFDFWLAIRDDFSGSSPAKGITISDSSLILEAGSPGKELKATVLYGDSNTGSQEIFWKTSNKYVATVDYDGKVTPHKPGKAIITASAPLDDSISATCEVTVTEASKVSVTGVSLNSTSLSLETGKSGQLTATVTPSDATEKGVTWKSSNTSVATVDSNGKVTAVKAGTADITVTTKDGNKTAICKVTVTDPVVQPPSTATTAVTPPTTQAGVPVGTTFTSGKITYQVTSAASVKLVKNTNKKAKKVTVPSTVNVNGKTLPVTEIGANAFKNNKKLTSIVIGKNVTKIGKNAFKGCKSLKKITVKTKKLSSSSIKNLAKSVKFRGAKLTVKVPKAKKKAYKKIFKKSAKKVKIK